MIGAAGFGGAFALAGGQREAWSCAERPWEKDCKTTSTMTLTVTTPGTTPGPGATTEVPPTTVVQPAPPPVTITVTTPAVTVTTPAVTTTIPGKPVVKYRPTCAHGDWDINAPRCRAKLIVACKGKYRKEIRRWCLRYEKGLEEARRGTKPKEIFHTEAGVTG
jgi:hypothetical protein